MQEFIAHLYAHNPDGDHRKNTIYIHSCLKFPLYIFFSYPRRFSSAIAIGFPKRCTIAHIHDLFATFRYLKYMYIMNKAPETATNRSSCKSLKGHFCSQNRFFLDSPTLTSNLPKSWKMCLRRYWSNRLPVLAKSPTCIGQTVYRYC